MIRRVIFLIESPFNFLIESPFNERDYNRFGIEILQTNGFQVEVWDCTTFINPEVYLNCQVPDPICYDGYRLLSTKEQLFSALRSLTDEAFIVCIIGYRYDVLFVYKALSESRLMYCVQVLNAIPAFQVSLIQKILQAEVRDIAKGVCSRIPFNWLGIRPASVLLAGGAQSIRQGPRYPLDQETKTLWCHALDYDVYLNHKDQPVSVENTTAVFLDEYVPFHPDYAHLGIAPPADPKHYFSSLCKFFGFLEHEYGLTIVIAAHPRSHYEKYPDLFGGRPVLKGKTVELVRGSLLTIAHCSTAISFSVLFHKPVLFITTNQLAQHPVYARCIHAMATWLNKSPINIDDLVNLDLGNALIVDTVSYAQYREAYIKKAGSPEKPTWQIVGDFLKML